MPIPLPDDPYVAVRQAQLVDTDTESEPEEAPLEAEDSQPLGSRVPLMSEEFEAFEPSRTRTISSHSSASSDSTAPLTARMIVRAQPAMSPGHSARVAEAMTLLDSAFRTSELILDIDSEGDELRDEDTKEDREDKSLDSDDEREGRDLDNKGQGLEDEGPGMEEEGEAILEGQQQAVPAADTTVGEPLGLGYGALRCRELAMGEDQVPTTFEVCQSSKFVLGQQGAKRVSASRQPTLTTWVDPTDGRVYTDIPAYVPPVAPVPPPPYPEWSSGSLPVSPSSPVVLSPIASLVATLASTISVDEDYFLEVGAQLELHGSILHDHSQRLDALPPTLFEGYDRYLRELYTRSGEVRDEIFSQSFRGMAGQTDAQMAALWHAIYDTQRDNHDLRRQITEERHERL
ncbi:hypothetical protein Tco_1257544 [Tanacetum coccineum]